MRLVKPSYEVLDVPDGMAVLKRIERAARVCYKSEDRITEDGSSAVDMVKSLCIRNHGAMLEMVDMTVLFVTDRGVSHELVRHRLASYAQESTRYCNYGHDGEISVICPDEIREDAHLYEDWAMAIKQAERTYLHLVSRKQHAISAQIARSVLPTCLKTEIVVKANLREWRHILMLRTAHAAHPQMRQLLIPLLTDVRGRIPVIFDDITLD